jgi:hypothetical protein
LLAPDKHIWFTERTGDKIAEVVRSNEIREFQIAQPASYPEKLAPGSDRTLWLTESQTGDLDRRLAEWEHSQRHREPRQQESLFRD